MKSPLFKNITPGNEKKSIRLNRRMVTFFICVLIAAFLWLMMSLSKEYNIITSFPVNYENLPQDKIVANRLPENIDIEIRATGFNLLIYKLKQERETVLIDIRDAKPLSEKNHYYLLCNSRIDKITAQFSSDVRIIRINPDTLFLNYNKKMTKQVPVKANLTIECDKQYQQTDSVKIEPAVMAVSGAADVLDKISYVETVPMTLKKVSAPLLLKLDILKTPGLKQVELSLSSVQARVNVAKYTEASLELPVEVENLPAGYSLKTFPDKVGLKCNVAFSEYSKINALQFHAIVDYNKIEEGNNKLKIQLVKFPEGIRAVKLSTEKVEYIIRK